MRQTLEPLNCYFDELLYLSSESGTTTEFRREAAAVVCGIDAAPMRIPSLELAKGTVGDRFCKDTEHVLFHHEL